MFSAGDFLGQYREKEMPCIYLRKSLRGFELVSAMSQGPHIEFEKIHAPDLSTDDCELDPSHQIASGSSSND